MKILILAIFLSFGGLADSKSRNNANHELHDKTDKHHDHHDNNALKANAINSPVQGNTLKVEIFPPKNYKIKDVFYVLYGKNGKPYWHPLAWKKAKLISNANTTLAEITFSLEVGPYKAFLLAVPENKKSENRKTWVSFSVAKLTEVPDPGEEGKNTLAGIDSDNDGVRDDVQRWVNAEYPLQTMPSTNKALKQFAESYQKVLINSSDKLKSIEFKEKNVEALSCLTWVTGNPGNARYVYKQLEAQILNTSERIKANLQANSHMHGRSRPDKISETPMNQRNIFCNFQAEKEF